MDTSKEYNILEDKDFQFKKEIITVAEATIPGELGIIANRKSVDEAIKEKQEMEQRWGKDTRHTTSDDLKKFKAQMEVILKKYERTEQDVRKVLGDKASEFNVSAIGGRSKKNTPSDLQIAQYNEDLYRG